MKKCTPKDIWLAGLGALARAEKEDDPWFEELMADGERFESEQKAHLDAILSEITEQIRYEQRQTKAKIGNIEHTFENKVSTTLNKLGLASKQELTVLKERLESIEKQIKRSDLNQ